MNTPASLTSVKRKPLTSREIPTTVTILDDEQAVGFSLPAYAVTEGVPSIAIPIVRAGPVPAGVAVTCQTVDGGTAVPGLDYRPVPPTTLVFAAGSRTGSHTCA